jgi:hypothetical protein
MSARARKFLIGAAAAVAAMVAAWASVRPTNDRRWIPEQAVLPAVRFEGNVAHVSGIRDFAYTARTTFTPAYYDRSFDLDRLTSAWFVLTPFSKRWRGPAHSFVTFGFADSQFVSISVEARREPGETYGALTGLFKQFELIYVIGDERDLIGQRAAFDSTPVYLYPIRGRPERIRAVFVEMLERANGLRANPEFYNTLTNNCTSNVVRHVNDVAPRTVPGGLKTILPGYTDEVAHRLGLIDTELDLEGARARFEINARARKYIGDPAFSVKIREAGPGTRDSS